MNEIKISVITVNYNNLCGLKKTVASVFSQIGSHFELLVIDAESTDGSAEYLKNLNIPHLRYLSEKDAGIFDGMNKGIKLALGQWVIFMNSGDQFVKNDVIHSVICKLDSISDRVQVLYGEKMIDGIPEDTRDVSKEIKSGGIFACHQSMFFRVGEECFYNTNYKIYGDYELLARLYSSYKEDGFYNLNIPICIYEGGGVSSTVTIRKRREKFKAVFQYFGIIGLIRAYRQTLVNRVQRLIK